MALLPELRVGVAVLTNQESGAGFNSIVCRLFDPYLGVKAPDYSTVYAEVVRQNREELRANSSGASAARDATDAYATV